MCVQVKPEPNNDICSLTNLFNAQIFIFLMLYIHFKTDFCLFENLFQVGAGTNPLEGAALGMSILESFAEAGALLTVATTHHGELKTLKYRYMTN